MKLKKENIKEILSLLCLCVCSLGITFIIVNLIYDHISKERLSALQNNIRQAREYSEVQLKNANLPTKKETESDALTEEETSDITDKIGTVLDAYRELHESNEDFYGWLFVDGTGIDYPVMQGPDNEFYLSHNMERKYDKYGMLILDDHCNDTLESSNMIVYGHNVHNGDLFGELINFKDKGYYGYHPYISFDNIYEHSEYEIFAVLRTTVLEAQDINSFFTTWNYDDKETFSKTVKWLKDKSLYEIDYEPSFKDKLLTLVTCEYTQEDGRFVVVAGCKNK